MRRSGYMWEAITAQFDFSTPLEKLDALEADMIHWLQTEPERLFVPSTAIVPQKIEYMRSLECTIGMTHADTWQDWGRRFYRKKRLLLRLHFLRQEARNQIRQPCTAYRLLDGKRVLLFLQATTLQIRDPQLLVVKTRSATKTTTATCSMISPLRPTKPADPRCRRCGRFASQEAKAFMNFTPPPDELEMDAANVRARKVRREAKKFANQGGDGGG